MDSGTQGGTLIKITAQLIKQGFWVLYPCRLHHKNLTVYQKQQLKPKEM